MPPLRRHRPRPRVGQRVSSRSAVSSSSSSSSSQQPAVSFQPALASLCATAFGRFLANYTAASINLPVPDLYLILSAAAAAHVSTLPISSKSYSRFTIYTVLPRAPVQVPVRRPYRQYCTPAHSQRAGLQLFAVSRWDLGVRRSADRWCGWTIALCGRVAVRVSLSGSSGFGWSSVVGPSGFCLFLSLPSQASNHDTDRQRCKLTSPSKSSCRSQNMRRKPRRHCSRTVLPQATEQVPVL